MASPAMLLLQTAASAAAQMTIAGVWQGALLLAGVALCLRLLPRAGAATRCAVWSATFATAVLLPIAEMQVHRGTATGGSGAAMHADVRWAMAIAGLWAVLALLRTAELAWQMVRLWAVWRRAVPLAGDEGALRAGTRRVTLCRSAEVEAPCVIGFFAPRLLLPEGLAETMTAAELRQIALHECEHVRRGDDWVNLLVRMATALFPLNPALLWMSRRMGREREMACDAGVVRATAAPLEYARCLTELAERRMRARRASTALLLSAWGERPELVERVHRLLRQGPTMSRPGARAVTSLLCLSLGAGGVALARAPQMVSFSTEAEVRATDAGAPMATVGAMEPVSFRATTETAHATRMMPAVAVLPSTVPDARGSTRTDEGRAPKRRRSSRDSGSFLKPQMSRTSAGATAERERRGGRRTSSGVYLLQTGFLPSYAAVPFGDGWLIVQL